MARAVCLRCGSKKRTAYARCARCKFDPATDEDALVKSVYLSLGRFDDEHQRARHEQELDEIAARIEGGEEPAFDVRELERLKDQKDVVDSVTGWTLATYFVRWVLPAVAFLLLLFGLAWVLRQMR